MFDSSDRRTRTLRFTYLMSKHVLVTGGNSGIGLALCKLLVTERGCNVFLGSRDLDRGTAAMKTIVDASPDVASKIEVLQVDVSDQASVAAAAETLKAKGVTLYALVNNAGIGLAHGNARHGRFEPSHRLGPASVWGSDSHRTACQPVNLPRPLAPPRRLMVPIPPASGGRPRRHPQH